MTSVIGVAPIINHCSTMCIEKSVKFDSFVGFALMMYKVNILFIHN